MEILVKMVEITGYVRSHVGICELHKEPKAKQSQY